MIDVKFTDNSNQFLDALKDQIALGLEAVGAQAQNYAVRNCPVDMGRLRNSITWAVEGGQGDANTMPKEKAMPKDYEKHGEPPKNEMYIGTNVEYAQYVEFRDNVEHVNGKAHFLRDALANHNTKYKAILQAALQGKD